MQKDKRIDELQKELDSLKAGNAKKLGESGANSGRSETADMEERCYDDVSGHYYLYNRITGQVRWEDTDRSVEGEATVAKPMIDNPLNRVKHERQFTTSETKELEALVMKALASRAESTQDPSSKHQHRRNSTKLPLGWDKYNDDEGRRYYTQRTSGSSSWEAPEGATGGSTGRPTSADTEEEEAGTEKEDAGKLGEAYDVADAETPTAPTASMNTSGETEEDISYKQVRQLRRNSTKLPLGWDKYNDDEGKRYYTNRLSGVSEWVAPEGATGGSTGRADSEVENLWRHIRGRPSGHQKEMEMQ